MQNFEKEGTIDYSRPDEQVKFYQTNLFLKEAAIAMRLPPEAGARAARVILKDIVHGLEPQEAQNFKAQLPEGLKQECEIFISERLNSEGPNRDIDAASIKKDIIEAAGLENIQPELIAGDFWGYLSRFLNERPGADKGETNQILTQLPADVEKLFGNVTEH